MLRSKPNHLNRSIKGRPQQTSKQKNTQRYKCNKRSSTCRMILSRSLTTSSHNDHHIKTSNNYNNSTSNIYNNHNNNNNNNNDMDIDLDNFDLDAAIHAQYDHCNDSSSSMHSTVYRPIPLEEYNRLYCNPDAPQTPPAKHTVTLFTKDNCSLCIPVDLAIINALKQSSASASNNNKPLFTYITCDIMNPIHSEWRKQYRWLIPVVHMDGVLLSQENKFDHVAFTSVIDKWSYEQGQNDDTTANIHISHDKSPSI